MRHASQVPPAVTPLVPLFKAVVVHQMHECACQRWAATRQEAVPTYYQQQAWGAPSSPPTPTKTPTPSWTWHSSSTTCIRCARVPGLCVSHVTVACRLCLCNAPHSVHTLLVQLYLSYFRATLLATIEGVTTVTTCCLQHRGGCLLSTLS